MKYRERLTLDERKKEYRRVMSKYKNERIPVILERSSNPDTPKLDREKYVLPPDITIAQLLVVIRKRVALPDTGALFLFKDNRVVSSNATIQEVAKESVSEDGFIYLTYTTENAFGDHRVCCSDLSMPEGGQRAFYVVRLHCWKREMV